MSTLTISDVETSLLAAVAAGLNGGRFAHLATDAAVRDAALEAVRPAREARRRASARKRSAARANVKRMEAAARAEAFAAWAGYSATDEARIAEVFAIFQRSPKRSAVRRIARALLAPETFARSREFAGWDAADIAAERRATLANWRVTIRAYSAARRELAIMGAFPISRFDASPTVDSRFYRNVVKHWHNYAEGRHVAIHGVTPDDVFQDAMVAAIESGDTLDGVPTFGNMYMHTRRATESAVYTYRRGHSHGEPFTAWEWADWEAWGIAQNVDAFAYSTMPEWLAYDAARSAHDATNAFREALAESRAIRSATLSESRRALASLVMSGMTVTRIAALLGRTVEAITADIERIPGDAPVTWLNVPHIPAVHNNDVKRYQGERRYSMGDIARMQLARQAS